MNRQRYKLGDISNRIWDKKVWDKCDELITTKYSCTQRDIKSFAVAEGINVKGALAEFSAWSRYREYLNNGKQNSGY